MEWFNQGYQKVQERQQQIDEQMSRTYLPQLIVKEEDEDAEVRFLTKEPITFYEHYLPSLKKSFTCPDNGDPTKGNCPLCAMGNKATFRGAYLVVDHRFESWTKDGKLNERQNTAKVAKFGVKVLNALGKMDAKLVKKGMAGGLFDVDFEVMRTGKGTDTMYQFQPVNKNEQFGVPELSDEPFKLLLEALKPKTKQELINIIQGKSGGQQQQQSYGNQINLSDVDDNDDVIKFA